MTIKALKKNHQWVNYPAFYNAYPLQNEIHPTARIIPKNVSKDAGYFIDTYYGRIFEAKYLESISLYGHAESMQHYVSVRELMVIEEFRVPYRKIPVFEVDDILSIQQVIKELEKANPKYRVLLRGQTKPYFLERNERDNKLLYGEKSIKEPSFLPSHLRNNFDEFFLECMWQGQAAILLNDIGYDYSGRLEKEKLQEYWKYVSWMRNSPIFTLFSLGIAQHYGLPSVGLDLSDDLEVASWFATNAISINGSGLAEASQIEINEYYNPTVFVFRCPQDAVFGYREVCPRIFPEGRPDRQKAWFGHVGWGAASNQLGSYLMCGFRLTKNYFANLSYDLTSNLFPSISEDPILEYFMKMRNQAKYEGEAKRALEKVYCIA